MAIRPIGRRRASRAALSVAILTSLLVVLPTGSASADGPFSVALDGVDDAVRLGTGSTTNPLRGTQFTLELWFKRTGAGLTTSTASSGGLTGVVPLITKGRSEADGTTADTNYFLGISSTGTLAADFESTLASANNNPVVGTTVISQNVWHHAAATFNGSSLCLFLDGVPEGTCLATTQVPRQDSIQPVGVGTSYNTASVAEGFFAGQIDDVRIWNDDRTLAQLRSTMTSPITTPTTGLVGRWAYDEGAGTSAANTAGSGSVTGTLVGGTTWGAGAPAFDPVTAAANGANNALLLDGVDDGVTLGTPGVASPLGSTQFTLETWFKRTGTGAVASTGTGGITTVVPLISKGRSEADGTTQDANYLLGIDDATGRLVADFESTLASANNNPVVGTTRVTWGTWHHAAATFNGSQFCLYLDGVLDGTCLATTQTPRSDSIQPPAIGTAADSTGARAGFFAGAIDEARIWNVPRTQAQIQASMNGGFLAPITGLRGRWSLDESSGTTVANTAGSANVNGTVVGGAGRTGGGPASALAPAPGNYAVDLDGAGDGITLGNAGSASPLGATEFTLELWFKRTGAGAGTSTGSGGVTAAIPLITKGRSEADGTNVDTNYFLGIDTATGTLAADFEDQRTSSNNNPVFGDTIVTQNVWHHAAATYDGAEFCLYLDGVLDGDCLATVQTPRSDSIQAPAIGTASNSTGVLDGSFDGLVDEVRIWDVAKSEAQIQTSINDEITFAATDLLGRWGMSEGAGLSTVGTATTISGFLVGNAGWGAGAPFDLEFNEAPVVDTVVIDQTTPTTNQTLSVTVTSHDNDGDTVTYDYQWTKNGTDIAGATSATLNLGTAGNGDRGDLIRVRVTADDGNATSAPVTSSPVTVANTAPSATVSLNTASPGTNDTLTATATRADADSDTVTLTYVWKVNGTVRKTTSNSSSLSDTFDLSQAGNGNNGDTITVEVTPNDGATNGAMVSDSASVGNAIPVVDTVVIDQTTPTTNQTLSVTVTSHDNDGDTVTYDYQWTKNGTDIAGATSATLNLGTAGNGDRGDLIRVRVTADDGNATSAPVTSSPVTVANTAPSATVSLNTASPGTNDTLTATATRADADSDTVTLTYVWKVNGTVRKTTSNSSSLSDTFDLSQAGNGNNGDTITVEVTPNDGATNGAMVSDSASVGNAIPVVDTVVIDQTTPTTNQTLSVTVTSHDNDGDTVTYDYQWTKNGTDIAGATSATLNLGTAGNGDRGDLIRVRVTADDGNATSAPVTSSPVTVTNTAPSATVSLNTASPGTNDTLTATATRADADSDTVTLTYVWKVNGTVRKTTSNSSSLSDTFDLSQAGNGNNGDTITVEVTPNDGATNGAMVSDSASVGNAIPVVDTVVIDQTTPTTNQTLSVTVTSHDNDGDTVTYDYQWTKNGTDIAGATSATLNLGTAGNGDRGDLIRVRVTADDGNATSAPVTSSPVTVANTAPSATVSLNTASPGTNDTLTATATRADADSDTVTLTYVWKVNGTVRKTTSNSSSLSDTFDLSQAGNGNNGDTITVEVTPNDGATNGAMVSDSASVGNAIPVVDTVVIDQTTPTTNQTLSVTVTSHDNDGDTVTYDYQWTKNGTDIAGATSATLNLGTAGNGDRGDLIRVRVTADDGNATSAPVTSSPVTVANTAPSATVSLNTASPGTNDTLTATATRADADSDTVTLTYVWKVNGTVRKTTSNSSSLSDTFDLSQAGNGNNGDTITVEVTPNDGATNGAMVSAQAVVNDPAAAIFTDEFTSGGFTNWTSMTRLTIDNAIGSPGAPSARAQVSAQSAFATKNLGGTFNQVCMSVAVNVTSGGGNAIDLLRLRTAANGPVAKVYLNAGGTLLVRSDVAGTQQSSGTALGTGWHELELCGTVGAATTWDLYRDGVVIINDWTANTGTTPVGLVQIGDTAARTMTVNFDHVRVDQSPGEGAPPPADTTPPTTPGKPTGSSPAAGQITISWAASSDASPPITYRIYRDGGTNPIGTTTNTTFTDLGLTGGNSHTYEVDAVDSAASPNTSPKSPASDPIVVQSGSSAIFTDEFTSGGFTNWTSMTRLTIDNAIGSPGAPSARAQVSAQSAFATKNLGGTFNQVCMSVAVNVTSGGGNAIDLLRLRTAANGPVAKVYLNAGGTLLVRSDVAGTQQSSGTALGTGWHELELCGTVGAATTWDLYRDGVVIINDWTANTGTTPVGLVQIGDTAARTMTVNFDHVRVDQSPGEGAPPPADTTPPTTPGKPTGSSPAAGQITISWAASSDASPPITYRIYRDGGTNPIGTTTNTTFTDLGLTGGNSHTYEVDAVDSAASPNTSPKSPASDPIVVQSGSSAIFTDEFTSGGFTNWTSMTRLTIDNAIGSPGAPSARAQVSAQSAFATKNLGGTFNQVCMSVAVNVTSGGGNAIDLLRLRTAANGPVAKVYLNAGGTLLVRSDVAGTQQSSGTALGTGWHELELCGTVGAATTWDLYRDGVVIINDWTANTGTTPVGLVQIGDTAARTMTVNFDHVRVDQVPG